MRVPGADGAALQIWLERQPVLEREVTSEGKKKGYRRTRQVLERRECAVCEWLLPSRLTLVFNDVTTCVVSVNTGRAVGMPDWVVAPADHKRLRKERRVRFPDYHRKKKPLGPAPVTAPSPEPTGEGDPSPPGVAALARVEETSSHAEA